MNEYVLSYLQNIDFYKRDGYFYSTLKIVFFVKNGKRDNHFSPFTNGMRIFIKKISLQDKKKHLQDRNIAKMSIVFYTNTLRTYVRITTTVNSPYSGHSIMWA